MMKIILLSFLLSGAAAFAPSAVTRVDKTALYAASTLPPKQDNGWSDRPAHKPKSTKPAPAKNVSWLERQTMKDVMIDPDYFMTFYVGALGPLIMWYHRKSFFFFDTLFDYG